MKGLEASVDGRRPEEAVLLAVRGRQGRQGVERWEPPELEVEALTAQRAAEGQPQPEPEVLAHALAVADSLGVPVAGVLKIGILVDPLLHSSVVGAPVNRASHHMPCHTEA